MCEDAARGHALSLHTDGGLSVRRRGGEPVCLTFIESIVLHRKQEASNYLFIWVIVTQTKPSSSTLQSRLHMTGSGTLISLRPRCSLRKHREDKGSSRAEKNSGSLPTWHGGEEEERRGEEKGAYRWAKVGYSQWVAADAPRNTLRV